MLRRIVDAFVQLGQSVFDVDVVDIDPARNGAGCYLVVKHTYTTWGFRRGPFR